MVYVLGEGACERGRKGEEGTRCLGAGAQVGPDGLAQAHVALGAVGVGACSRHALAAQRNAVLHLRLQLQRRNVLSLRDARCQHRRRPRACRAHTLHFKKEKY